MTIIEKNSVFEKTDSFVETEVDGEVVLMDINEGRFSSLAQTGKTIWGLIDGERSLDAIVSYLTTEYDVEEKQCFDEVVALLSDLTEKEAVRAVV